jgi:small GTP-binding protein
MFENTGRKIGSCDGDLRVKIVTFGSYHSGKTSFVKCINPNIVSTEVKSGNGSTTVAFDLAIREHKGLKLYVYGTPGQERFETARTVVSFGLHAGVVIVDSTRGMTDFEKNILSELRSRNIPCVVLANKQDVPGASLDKVVSDAGGFEDIYPISARTGQGVLIVLDRLVELVKPN